MIIVVAGIKGGVGKTTIATEVASRIDGIIITNERNSIIEEFILKDRYFTLEEDESLIERIDKVQQIYGNNKNIIIDFAGKIDTRITDAIIKCDVYLTPTSIGELEQSKCAEDLIGLALCFYQMASDTEVSSTEEKEKLIDNVLNEFMQKVIIVCNECQNLTEAEKIMYYKASNEEKVRGKKDGIYIQFQNMLNEYIKKDIKEHFRYCIIPHSTIFKTAFSRGQTIEEIMKTNALSRINLAKINKAYQDVISFITNQKK